MPIEQYREIERAVGAYFDRVVQAIGLEERGNWADIDHYWSRLPNEMREEAARLLERLARLVQQVGPVLRSSPLITETDLRDTSHAIKGARAAIRLHRYSFWGPHVLHDEDTVLGVSPAGQSEDNPLHPVDAAAEFRSCSDRIVSALTLVTPPGQTPADWALPAAAGRLDVRTRPGTAFVMMWLSPDRPELVDVSDSIRRCFQAFDITAVRADEIEHADVITDRIRDEIRSAEFLVADLTGERPSVYYEVGFAHAIIGVSP